MSDTPRTDAAIKDCDWIYSDGPPERTAIGYNFGPLVDLCRELERALQVHSASGGSRKPSTAEELRAHLLDEFESMPQGVGIFSAVLYLRNLEIDGGPPHRACTSETPRCDCKGPWCEGKDRFAKVECLGYQIDSDGGAT